MGKNGGYVSILGGTFDPVHSEHIKIAKLSMEKFKIEKVYFSISKNPPHKNTKTPFYHRYTMLNLAINRYENFLPLTLEIEHPAARYTINLIEIFLKKYGVKREKLFFLAGGDSLKEIKTWREYRKLLKNYRFIFVVRKSVFPGKEIEDLMSEFDIFDLRGKKKYKKHIEEHSSFLVDYNLKDISSTEIRNMLKSDISVEGKVPFDVLKYIKKSGVYG